MKKTECKGDLGYLSRKVQNMTEPGREQHSGHRYNQKQNRGEKPSDVKSFIEQNQLAGSAYCLS